MVSKEYTKKNIDWNYLIYVAVLVCFGLAMLASASAPMGYVKFNDSYFYLKRQVLYGILPGALLCLVALKLNSEFFRRFAWIGYFACVILLILAFIPGLALVINGSNSWVQLFGFSFQPGEFMKLGLIFLMASMLSDPRRDLKDWQYGLLPVLVFVALPLGLVLLQPDLGTMLILGAIAFFMLFYAKLPWSYLIVIGALGLTVFGAMIMSQPYRMERLNIFMHPELDPQGVGYHVNQAFLAVGSGGFWGLGYGHSRQKYQYLPEVNADSIYAVIAEEMGFVVSAGLLFLILLIATRGLKIAKNCTDDFDRYIVVGVTAWFFCQSMINIGAMVGVMPLTGVPLPFISHGGSAMLASLIAVGVVLNLSKNDK